MMASRSREGSTKPSRTKRQIALQEDYPFSLRCLTAAQILAHSTNQFLCWKKLIGRAGGPRYVRCYSNSGQTRVRLECLLCASSGPSGIHSITSSARPISVLGMLIPSALAVFRLIYISTLVACCTGRSTGLSPLGIRPV
jgi:hypothetical protein